ncbi:hypothetical protein L6164_019946 [Bauhinia variegata]|uniref:Uncharacterized protein n=1 Tax=Bauhinia variegata TaxID=167791 RepID=A0ACB9MTS6_BAUVA|nr:hypothetical protein L6164_019946 [Bauhinia variegata]
MAEMLLEATVGAFAGELLKAILQTKDRTIEFRPILEDKLRKLERMIEQIEEYYRKLDRPNEELEGHKKKLKEGKEFVLKCSEINWWNFCVKPGYQVELKELDDSLFRFLNSDLLAMILLEMI